MPGIIFDIKPFAIHDGPGIRTTVFLKGCPLRCLWCHNPESWHPAPESAGKSIILDGREFRESETIGREVTVQEVMAEIRKERIIMEESGGGITFSGGEPLMQPGFLAELLEAAWLEGFHTAVDTSGHAPKSDFERILPYTSLFLYDIKIMDDPLHTAGTGVSNQLALENFSWLIHQGKPVRIRIPLVRNITATRENINAILGFLSPHVRQIGQIDLLPYHRNGIHKYRKLGLVCQMPPRDDTPEPEEIEEIGQIFRDAGFRIKKGG